MYQELIIIFVCEHGAAKSILAATYFNKLAGERKLNVHAIARGTNPDQQLSTKTIDGLRQDALIPAESLPKKLTGAEVEYAQRIISFCELPEEYQGKVSIEQWDNIPPVSENYEIARDAILEKLNAMLK